MSEFKADCSIEPKDRLSIDLNKDSGSICIMYNDRFSQIILSEVDVNRLKEFIKELDQ